MRHILWGVLGFVGLTVGLRCSSSNAADGAPTPAPLNPTAAAGLAALPAAIPDDACHGRDDAFISARLRGAANFDVHWRVAAASRAVTCDGGVRPDGRGLRVTFSGRDHGHRLLFIYGIRAPPRVGVYHNVATNLTVIFEGEQRVYSTVGDDRCTIDALDLRALPTRAGSRLLGARARGFCISPASALGDGAALLISRFDFSAALFLDATLDKQNAAPNAQGAPRASSESR